EQLEVAVLDRNREHRKFKRLTRAKLEQLLASAPEPPAEGSEKGPDKDAATDTDADKGKGSGEKPPPTGPEGPVDDGSSPL
ncbi:MAG TPA: proteasome subunit alpha, partial [Nonomuraea sp.]|nr:proteasome subunit alpha [Nonomuraea sp.]